MGVDNKFLSSLIYDAPEFWQVNLQELASITLIFMTLLNLISSSKSEKLKSDNLGHFIQIISGFCKKKQLLSYNNYICYAT
jgi:hypothetical protein